MSLPIPKTPEGTLRRSEPGSPLSRLLNVTKTSSDEKKETLIKDLSYQIARGEISKVSVYTIISSTSIDITV